MHELLRDESTIASHGFAPLPGGLRRAAKNTGWAAYAAPLKKQAGRLTPLRYKYRPRGSRGAAKKNGRAAHAASLETENVPATFRSLERFNPF